VLSIVKSPPSPLVNVKSGRLFTLRPNAVSQDKPACFVLSVHRPSKNALDIQKEGMGAGGVVREQSLMRWTGSSGVEVLSEKGA